MERFAAGVIVTIVCIIGGVYAYFAGGFAPVATASRPMPFEKKLAKIALNAKLQKEMPMTVTIEANEANYLAGAHEYLMNCAVCHGVPGRRKLRSPAESFQYRRSYSTGRASPTIRQARHFGRWRMEFG